MDDKVDEKSQSPLLPLSRVLVPGADSTGTDSATEADSTRGGGGIS